MNNYELLVGIAKGRMKQFPEGNEIFQILARILEEAGELAQAVNHREGVGSKKEKNGLGHEKQIAGEAVDLIENVIALLIYYDFLQLFDSRACE
jgi:NTP pyrophosphatase (non-canonical NTP hydrolase)